MYNHIPNKSAHTHKKKKFQLNRQRQEIGISSLSFPYIFFLERKDAFF